MTSGAQYDSADNMTSYRKPGSDTDEKYRFTYEDTDADIPVAKEQHLPVTSETPEEVKTYTQYDHHGNATATRIGIDELFIKTETGYTTNGNYVTTQTDARGNTVTNTVDANGKVLSVTDPAAQTVSYTYDASNRVTEVSTTYGEDAASRTSKNEYTYENDRIKTVAHNTTDDDECDVVYTFDYDDLGRKTTVKVGTGSETDQTLSTNMTCDCNARAPVYSPAARAAPAFAHLYAGSMRGGIRPRSWPRTPRSDEQSKLR